MSGGKGRVLAVWILVALAASSLVPLTAHAQDGGETWTLMVYMSGDSSLDENMAADIREMQLGGRADILDIIVLSDSSGYSDTELTRIEGGTAYDLGIASANASWSGELDLGEPGTLSQFVVWATEAYPADRYMLDLWGHGSGWPGICPDKGNYLDASDLNTAFTTISAAGIKLDLVSMDACQMGMLEVAREIRGAADYLLFSQKDVPVAGWPYDLFLDVLSGNGTVEDKGAAMIGKYMTWGRANSYYSLTLSLIDVSETDALASALDRYAAEAASEAGYFNREFSAARMLTEKYDGNAQYDILHLLGNIDNATHSLRLAALADAVRSAFSSAVVCEESWSADTDPEKADHAGGLSVWFPVGAPTEAYLATSFARDTEWDGFLATMSAYFQLPGREDAPYAASALPLDSDGDGLLDAIRVAHPQTGAGWAAIEVYGQDGSLYAQENVTLEGITDIALEAGRSYEAAVYLASADGTLLNYTYLEGAFCGEALITVSGHVRSGTGRGLRWVSIALLDSDGRTLKNAVTDFRGSYSIEVVVPRETDGTGLVLRCGYGAERKNITIDNLSQENVFDFTLESSGPDTAWFVGAGSALNLAAVCCLVYWAVRSRRPGKPGK